MLPLESVAFTFALAAINAVTIASYPFLLASTKVGAVAVAVINFVTIASCPFLSANITAV